MLFHDRKVFIKPFAQFHIPRNGRTGQRMDFFDQPNRQIAPVLLGVIHKPLLQGRTIDGIQFAAVQICRF